jgi:hypothetical protein
MKIEDWDRIDIFLKSHPSTVARDLDLNKIGEVEEGRNESNPVSGNPAIKGNIFTFFTSKAESGALIQSLKYEADKLGMGFDVESHEPPPGSFDDIYTFYACFYDFAEEYARCNITREGCATCPMMERCMDGGIP